MLFIKDIIKAFVNSIDKNIIPSLILLYGSYGSGKTTLARIYAKAVNCLSNCNTCDKPCNKCKNCLNSNEFIFEFNSSNYTQIDHMRDIINDTKYKPYNGKYKFYILDEIHMLSQKSMNILLKEVEEPLKHIRYICITTNLEMILDSLVSRAICFCFKMLTVNEINFAIEELLIKANKLNIEFEYDKTKKFLLEEFKNSTYVSYRNIVNKLIQAIISDYKETENEQDYCSEFIQSTTNTNINLRDKIEKLKILIKKIDNIQTLLNCLFQHFMWYVIEYNDKKALNIVETIVRDTNIALQNQNGLIVLISKIHFALIS